MQFHCFNPQRGDYEKIVCFYNEHGEDLLHSGNLPGLNNEALIRIFGECNVENISSEGLVKYRVSKPPTALVVLLTTNSEDWEIVACGMMACRQTFRRYIGTIEYILVRKKDRGNGLGRYVMEALHKGAREIGVERIELTSELSRVAARDLYTSLGYRLVEGSNKHFVFDL